MPTATNFFGGPTDEPVCKVVCWWDRNVRFAQDTKHDGAPFAGLAGQVFFFGIDEGHTIAPRGEIVAEWYDITGPLEANAQPLWRCVYKAEDLHRMKQKGPVGPAYTLFLDWPNYRPQVQRVLVRVRFNPANGGDPVFADWAQITLHADAPITRHETNFPIATGVPFTPAPH